MRLVYPVSPAQRANTRSVPVSTRDQSRSVLGLDEADLDADGIKPKVVQEATVYSGPYGQSCAQAASGIPLSIGLDDTFKRDAKPATDAIELG